MDKNVQIMLTHIKLFIDSFGTGVKPFLINRKIFLNNGFNFDSSIDK